MLESPLLTIDEAAALLRCGRTRVFELIAEGRIERAPKFGKKTTVKRASVLACIDEPIEPASPLPPKRFRPRPQTVSALRAAFRTGALNGAGSDG